MTMAASAFLLPSFFPKLTLLAAPLHRSSSRGLHLRCSPNGAAVPESPKPASRRGRKKSPSPSTPKAKATRRRTKKADQESDSEGEEEPAKRTIRRTRKSKQETKQEEVEAQAAIHGTEKTNREAEEEDGVDLESDNDDGVDFSNEWPPLVCCFGAPRWEFVPTVRVSDRQMHPDQYSTWRHLQWEPPEFARAPGSAASNVAIAISRLGGRAAVLGKVGDDDFGRELVYRMNCERVQTRAIRFDGKAATATARMKVGFRDREDGNGGTKLVAETVKCSAEDSLRKTEVNLDVLKEARMFHFNSEVLLTPSMHDTLFRAIELSKKFGSKVFFDLNLPLPLWTSRDETKEVIKRAWKEADIIEVSRDELEFLLDHEYYEYKRNTPPQYYLEGFHFTRNWPQYYHYTPEEIAPIWHDGIKILLVTYGTLRIHYYTPKFHGCVVGTEDALITPYTTDRTGSGDAVVAAAIRKLTSCPEMYEDQDILERQLRFAVAAGIISQWTIGAVRGFPTESAAQNLKEQVYVPSMW
ncbi:fructokinase-like 1, chloroplastic [Phragmites australis]|uniref:fructokinase-like 1, chloroplastic n=1 Tax=Phragmites australis TaxID=29695 RepID=UPI002D79C1B6|nr:fructokinase-like 1, chloroplastic [Phragmites australis]XP_062207458.1 fructokinase-like 1, chloroplastic [Phragmites australis]XP_062207459.1 fructokinase-like 1, chloroplastic [Phragmites australis]XP_062207460.1 fructokinase-like 1, chloroplastic [Phragmites australis]